VAKTFDRITQNPNVLAGQATIRGLRISVAHVVELVANDRIPAQIVADLPDLEEDDVRQALAYGGRPGPGRGPHTPRVSDALSRRSSAKTREKPVSFAS
jgi:uncharacterized protein (DUF433 family)